MPHVAHDDVFHQAIGGSAGPDTSRATVWPCIAPTILDQHADEIDVGLLIRPFDHCQRYLAGRAAAIVRVNRGHPEI